MRLGGRGGIGFVPQDDIVIPELRVEMRCFQRTATSGSRVPFHQRAFWSMKRSSGLGLGNRHSGSSAFRGQRKRVSIATSCSTSRLCSSWTNRPPDGSCHGVRADEILLALRADCSCDLYDACA